VSTSEQSIKKKRGNNHRKMYANFAGIDTSKADIALENPENQAILAADNILVDWRGFLSNERPLVNLGDIERAVTHVRWFSLQERGLVYATREGDGQHLYALAKDIEAPFVWPADAPISSTVFTRRAVLFAPGQAPALYDGGDWSMLVSPDIQGARFCAAVQNRLVVAGFDDNPNEIMVSRANDLTRFPDDELQDEASVLRAFRFNIENLIGTADEIQGIAQFESNKLAIYTSDQVLIYTADPDLGKWAIDDRVNINYGTLSHNTISGSGDEQFFCSRYGVHSLRRSALNGVTFYTLPLSQKVGELYRKLITLVKDPRLINAVYDRDDGRYHIMFPVHESLSYRLSLAVAPQQSEGQSPDGRWSMSTFAGPICGDFLGGRLAFGTIAGIKEMLEESSREGERGVGTATFPLLWQDDHIDAKHAYAMALMASGAGVVTMECENEAGRELSRVVFELPEDDQVNYIGVPLATQFLRPFNHQYHGLRIKLSIEGKGQVRVFAVGVITKHI